MKKVMIALIGLSTVSAFANPVEYICQENSTNRYSVWYDLENNFAHIEHLSAKGKPEYGAIASQGVSANGNKITAMIAAGAGESVELFNLVESTDGKATGTYFDPFSGNTINLDCELSN